jgi:hypothetical protein
MNYFEACNFCELVKKYNDNKLKSFLGSSVEYIVIPAVDKCKPLLNADFLLITLHQNTTYKISSFNEDYWDVLAYASNPVIIKLDSGQELKRLPACYLSFLYYDTTISEKELCIKAMQRFLDVGNLEIFWNEIYKEGISFLV